jgi:hypothetical protein
MGLEGGALVCWLFERGGPAPARLAHRPPRGVPPARRRLSISRRIPAGASAGLLGARCVHAAGSGARRRCGGSWPGRLSCRGLVHHEPER